jgi:Flp pilus assembly protein protease CpaA
LLGGDAEDILRFLYLMSLIGSGLAILLLLYLRIFRRKTKLPAASALPSAPDEASDHAKVPYAVAVALAATIVLFLQSQRA